VVELDQRVDVPPVVDVAAVLRGDRPQCVTRLCDVVARRRWCCWPGLGSGGRFASQACQQTDGADQQGERQNHDTETDSESSSPVDTVQVDIVRVDMARMDIVRVDMARYSSLRTHSARPDTTRGRSTRFPVGPS
jgi:hypothetical protein